MPNEMSRCVVLGNGPALGDSQTWNEDMEGRFRIGVNRSFNLMWAPIGVTADEGFYISRNLKKFQPMAWLYRNEFPNAPYWTKGCSGAFGLWVAWQMGFRDIKLVGFGGVGHLYNSYPEQKEKTPIRRSREENNRKLWQGIKEIEAENPYIRITGKLPEPPDRPIWGKVRAV